MQSDLDKGLNHILLARANSKKRADELFDKIYSNYKIYNPVIIHSDRKKLQNRDSLDLLKSGKSQIESLNVVSHCFLSFWSKRENLFLSTKR